MEKAATLAVSKPIKPERLGRGLQLKRQQHAEIEGAIVVGTNQPKQLGLNLRMREDMENADKKFRQ